MYRQPSLLLLFFVLFTACDALKPVQSPNTRKKAPTEPEPITGQGTYQPGTAKVEPATKSGPVTDKVDTVVWTELKPPRVKPPFGYQPEPPKSKVEVKEEPKKDIPTAGTELKSIKLQSYKIAFLLPFLTDLPEGEVMDSRQLYTMHFYQGAKMAMEELAQAGRNLEAVVVDTRANADTLKHLLERKDIINANALIGPLRQSDVPALATFANTYHKPLVCPLIRSDQTVADNPYFIQSSPGLLAHLETMLRHALDHFKPEQIVLVARNTAAEVERLRILQELYRSLAGEKAKKPLTEAVSDDLPATWAKLNYTSHINSGKTVFLVPSFSNEAYITSVLRALAAQKDKESVTVFGMPQWMDMNSISYDYFQDLKLHITSDNFPEQDENNNKEFQLRYYDKYFTVPTAEAYAGYDATMYLGQLLHAYGTQCSFNAAQLPFQGVGNKLSMEGVGKGRRVDYFENRHVYMLKFVDYKLVKAQ